MFYSETLLSKTGPLARVWLSANLERKLSKTHILQSNLQDSVEAIITPNQAPMALRLSGQLLLGVVRIYSRKARYLLDDCNEALVKIKMAFRSSGNNDIPANLHMPNKESLMLPDRITAYDNLDLMPPPDANFLLSQIDDVTATPLGRKGRVSNRDINLQEDFNNSQFLQEGFGKDDEMALANMDDLDLELDFGMDLDEGPSVEMGRDAPAVEDDIFSELDMHPRGKDRDTTLNADFGDDGVRIADGDDLQMGDADFQFDLGEQSVLPGALPDLSRARISESPLSDIDDQAAQNLEQEVTRYGDLYEPEDETEHTVVRRATQRAKKRKILQADEETMLSSTHIREQQAKHDNILKPQSFLPRDPYVLALAEMHKSGGFVSSIMLDGRSAGWAPELKGLISLEAIQKPNDLKRKRDSGIADMDSDQDQAIKSPRLNIGEDDGFMMDGADFGNQTFANDESVRAEADRTLEDGTVMPAFDDTVAPHVHPADSGPVSLGTKHAVHILRDLFGPEAATNADKRKKTSVVFQELLPEERTTKADATKMFFECLVLATKDAIKVEQPEGSLGGPIRVRGKRGLWGAWAEREAGGEISTQDEPEPAIAAGSAAVAVEA
ncbi:uncharacterized protein E0L32_011640 [Thyridium curvatum]|uniref:Double-strand-break repair protein rad21 n=1 Tax=Thyridium curvatum TaxID=1093900 RepID=A0A507B5Q5_9PEZI|nr:uncharacterized protein E0L32_011640 [Thyridium curvatum]TPX18455.1 hypothetical protein E0L32_011640 [Thyridium curvatum]